MKQKHSILFLAFLLLLSCKKTELNRITKITTDKVVVNNTDVTTGGTIIDIGKEGITTFGHCWSTYSSPTINDAKTEFQNPTAGSSFSSSITNISIGSIYYIRAYASNSSETVYGEVKTVSLTSYSTISIVSTNLDIQNETTLTIDGSIAHLGAITALDYGHCWAMHAAPTLADNKTNYGALSNDINFSSSLNNLNLETTYYVRAYLKLNNSTIIYSNELTTLIPDLKVTTDNYTIAGTTASLQGTIINLGVLPVTDHGMCWSSTTSNPNFNNAIIPQGAATITGQYYCNLTGLVSGTTYYYRAFARKGNIIKYGIVKSFSY